jgi:hypothetical protein
MERMRRGEEARETFMADIRAFVRQLVADLKDAPAPMATGKACAACGKPMRVIPSTKRGEFFQRCSDCGITEKG